MSVKSIQPSRRSVARGAAWAVPSIAIAAAAPSAAASLRVDPGINGWVLNSYSRNGCTWSLDVNSNPSNPTATPDGAPYGLYLYNIQPAAVISNASLTYWVLGNHSSSNTLTWSTGNGHSSCWSGPATVGTALKPDGLTYTGYRWSYTCPITPSQVSPDGRLRLGNFHVSTSVPQDTTNCSRLNFWTERTITVDQDGSGPQPADVLTFQRRNGTDGPYTGGQRAQAKSADGASGGVAAS